MSLTYPRTEATLLPHCPVASVFPDDSRLFLHVIHTVYKHCMFVRTDEPHVIRSSSELTNPISSSSLTNLISLIVPLHKLSLYLVLCKMTRNCSVCKQYVCSFIRSLAPFFRPYFLPSFLPSLLYSTLPLLL